MLALVYFMYFLCVYYAIWCFLTLLNLVYVVSLSNPSGNYNVMHFVFMGLLWIFTINTDYFLKRR